MTKQAIIEHTIDVINQLSDDKAAELAAFADLLITLENEIVAQQTRIKQLKEEATDNLDKLAFDRDIRSLATNSAFDFLKDEEDLYSENDLKRGL